MDSTNEPTHSDIGALIRERRYSSALAMIEYRGRNSQTPSTAEDVAWEAWLLMKLGRTGEAIDKARRLYLRDHTSMAIANFASILLDAKRTDEALEVLSHDESGDKRVLREHGRAELAKGRWDAAISLLEQASSDGVQDESSFVYLHYAYLRASGDVSHLNELESRWSSGNLLAGALLARHYAMNSKWVESEAILKERARLDPESISACLDLLEVMAFTSPQEVTDRYAEELVLRFPANGEVAYCLAKIYYRRRKYRLASATLERCVQEHPESERYVKAFLASSLRCGRIVSMFRVAYRFVGATSSSEPKQQVAPSRHDLE